MLIKKLLTIVSINIIGYSSVYSSSKLFSVELTDTATGATAYSDDSNFIDLISDSIKTDGPFSGLDASIDYSGTIKYFGVNDAIRLERQVSPTGVETARISSPLTGLDQSFSASNENDLQDDIEDWVLEDGAAEIAKLDKAIAELSAASISDGNPGASTALAASDAFESLGFSTTGGALNTLNTINGENTEASGFSIGLGIGLNAGKIEIDTPSGDRIEGTKLSTQIPFNINFNERIRVIGSIPIDWTELGETNIYGGGINTGLQYDVIQSNAEQPWGWKATPFAGASGRGTIDGAAGTLIGQLGFTNAITYVIPKKALFTFGTQISHFDSIAVTIEDKKIEADINQQILKNGLKASIPFAERFLSDFYVTNTAFLQDAAIKNYWTLGTGLSFRITKSAFIGLHLNMDTSENYSSYNIGLGSAWRF